MTSYVALVRAINVAGHNICSVGELRALVEKSGGKNVVSLLQTGNFVFEAATRSAAVLETMVEQAIARRAKIETDVFVRTDEEWRRIIADNPFQTEASRDPARLLLLTLKTAPAKPDVAVLIAAVAGPELVEVIGRNAYVVYPEGVGRSKLTMALIEKKLKTRGTGRNWNTVLKIGALFDARRSRVR